MALSYIAKASGNCFFLYSSLPWFLNSSASFCSGVRLSGGGSSFFTSFFGGSFREGGLKPSPPAPPISPKSMPCMAMMSSRARGSWFINCIIIVCCMAWLPEPNCRNICTFCIRSLSCMYSLIFGFLAAAVVKAAMSNLRPGPPPELPPPGAAPGTPYFASDAFFKPSFSVASSGANLRPALYVSIASSYFSRKNSAKPLRV
mmetsp:Transcript_16117/g.45889  ORF Transcript_16117/g.45889 Transcript_16117/m.45889 type:complete len:202 (+) Transcript_16117:367-972(+)